MKSFFSILVIIILVQLNIYGAVEKVLGEKERQKVLQEGDLYITYSEKMKPLSFEKTRISFYNNADSKNINAEKNLNNLTDKEILSYAAEKYLPKGTISRKDILYLMFDFGALKEGKAFNIKIGSLTYSIIVSAITEDTYTLSYNKETMTIRLADAIRIKTNLQKPVKQL